MGQDQQISGNVQNRPEISYNIIMRRCKLLEDAHHRLHMFSPQPIPWHNPSQSIYPLPSLGDNSPDCDYFIRQLACLFALSKNRMHITLENQIENIFVSYQIKWHPVPGLTCKKLQSYLNCKCECECGVLSPLEFDHEKVSFDDTGKRKQEYFNNSPYTEATLPPWPPDFDEAVSQISTAAKIPEKFARICILSAVSSIAQGQIHFPTIYTKPQAINFSPIFIVASEEVRLVLAAALEKAYEPLFAYQANLPSDGVKTDIEYKKIAKIRRQLQKIEIGSKAYKNIFKTLKELEDIPEKHDFFISEWTPSKFFKQLVKHPEACCILDTQGEFIHSLLKNTRGVDEILRFLRTTQTPGMFRYEDEYERRHDIQKRCITINSIITRKEYDQLMGRRSKKFVAFFKKIFPICVDFELQRELYIAKPMLNPDFMESLIQDKPDRYSENMHGLIKNMQNMQNKKEYPNVIVQKQYTLDDNKKNFNSRSSSEQLLLYYIVEILMATYEATQLVVFQGSEYSLHVKIVADHLLYSAEKAYNNSTKSPVLKIIYRIKKILIRNNQYYFRLRTLHNKILSNLNKEAIQVAINRMIDEGDVQVIKHNSAFVLEAELSPKAGQLYAFNMQKAKLELQSFNQVRDEEMLAKDYFKESKQNISHVENKSTSGNNTEQTSTVHEPKQDPQGVVNSTQKVPSSNPNTQAIPNKPLSKGQKQRRNKKLRKAQAEAEKAKTKRSATQNPNEENIAVEASDATLATGLHNTVENRDLIAAKYVTITASPKKKFWAVASYSLSLVGTLGVFLLKKR